MREQLLEFVTLNHPAFKEPKNTAFVFPGQGIQRVGMGLELFNYSPRAREIYKLADEAVAEFDFAVTKVSFEGPKDLLDITCYTQPAILTYNHSNYETIRSECEPDFKPAIVAGVSLGEYSAVIAANVAPLEKVLKASFYRGKGMIKAGNLYPGGKIIVFSKTEDQRMYAVVSRYLYKEVGLKPGIIMTSTKIGWGGSEEDLQRATKGLKEFRRKEGYEIGWARAAMLPFHTQEMEPAVPDLEEALDEVPISEPTIPIIANTNGEIINSAGSIKGELIAHLTSPVRWVSSVRVLSKIGIRYVVEPGNKEVVLSNSRFPREDQIIIPVRCNNGAGPVVAHILIPREEAYAA